MAQAPKKKGPEAVAETQNESGTQSASELKTEEVSVPEANKPTASQAAAPVESLPAAESVEDLQKQREALQQEVQAAQETLQKANRQLADLELRAGVVRAQSIPEAVGETGECRFARDLIGRDIRRLETAYTELRDLVLADLESRGVWTEPTGETVVETGKQRLARNLFGIDIRRLETGYADLTELLLLLQDQQERVYMDLNNSIDKLQNELIDLVNNTHSSLSTAFYNVEAQFTGLVKDELSPLQTEVTHRFQEMESSFTEYRVTTDNIIRSTQEEFNRLNMDLNGLSTRIDNDLVQLQNKIFNEIKNEVDRLKGSVTQEVNKVTLETHSLKTSKESSIRTLAQYLNRLATAVNKNQDLTRFGLDNAMKKLENTGST